jgi:methionyl-tRNA synthetase
MSKSLGNVLDPFEVMEQYGTDALRFYLLRDVPFGADGAVGIDAVRSRYDSELANEYGNLASRTVAMIHRYRDGVVPAAELDPVLAGEFAELDAAVGGLMDRAEVSQALEAIWQRVRRCNRYVEERAPWQLARDPAQAAALDTTLASLAEALRVLTILLHPFMPATTQTLLTALTGSAEASLAEARLGAGHGGGRVDTLEPLFPRR